jgi:hypothetical protein
MGKPTILAQRIVNAGWPETSKGQDRQPIPFKCLVSSIKRGSQEKTHLQRPEFFLLRSPGD